MPRFIIIVACTVTAVIAVFIFVYARDAQAPVAISQPTVVPTTNIPTASPAPSTKPSITLTFGGDVMLGRTVESRIESNGAEWLVSEIAPTLSESDIAVINLESPFKKDAPQTPINSLVLRGDPRGIASLTAAGIDVVSLANNHITDMRIAGLQDTLSLLQDAKIQATGAGFSQEAAATPAVIERGGIRFGFLSYTYGVNFTSKGVYFQGANEALMREQVRALKESVDVVTVLCHCGLEYAKTPSTSQQAFSRAAIDAGAALVIGHHPHVPQPIERYNSGVIAYSLGNLIFDQLPGEWRDRSALLSVTFTGSDPQSLKLTPYRIRNFSKPFLATETESKEIVERFGLSSETVLLENSKKR